jgi:long-chain acyl-CoA synthetase
VSSQARLHAVREWTDLEKAMYRSIPALFLARVEDDPDTDVAFWKEGGEWQCMNWRAIGAETASLAKALQELGVKKGTRVGIVAETRKEWAGVDMAVLCLGGVTVGIYPSLLSETVAYILDHAEVELVVVENAAQAAKVAEHRASLPLLKHVLCIDPVDGLKSTNDIGHPPDIGWLKDEAAKVQPDDVCTLIYTSGTTGDPKGAILTHGNFLHVVYATGSLVEVTNQDRGIVFLPMAHSLQRMAGYRGYLQEGSGYYCSIPELQATMSEVRPTIMATVPRMLEKIHARAEATVFARGGLVKRIYDWAFAVGRRRTECIEHNQRVPRRIAMQYALADRLVFSKIRARLGGELRLLVSGGSALNTKVAYWFWSLGIPVLEGWGLTETAAPATANQVDDFRIGTVGKPIDGIEVKLDSDGEILVRGPGVFQGYFKDEGATKAAFTDDGWFRTGDIGEFDRDGFLKITDRKKELIVTAGGKNIAPVLIEKKIERSPYVMQAVAIGDDRPFLVALISPDVEELPQLAKQLNIPMDEPEQLVRHPDVQAAFLEAVREANRELPRFEQIKRFEVLSTAFSVETGELTPTMKLKRRIVASKYGDRIDALYNGGGIDAGTSR